MKYSVKVLLFGVIISLFACDDEQRQSGSTGKLNVRITASGSVTDVTTRSEEVALPSVDDFALTLLQGETVKGSWAKVSDYPEDVTFPVGSYTLKASYGDSDSEGFESPYYEGKSELEIRGGATTDVETICRLANTKISVQYTDDFKSYFKTYSTAIKSEGGSEVTFASNESRAAYVKPGRVAVNVTFTKVNGGLGSTTLEVATIDEALPQHHYHLLMDVDTGKATLTIVFDRVTEEKPIQLDISDQALNIKAPYFTLTGFEKTNDQTNQWDGNLIESSKLSALLTSLGGFKKCMLRAESPSITDWPVGGIDLANLTDETLHTLTRSGFKLTGFGDNKDQMAIIDFTGVAPHLGITDDNSTHLFYLEATSTYGKSSEAYVLNVTTPKDFMLLPTAPVKMKSTEVTLPVKLKKGNPQDLKLYYKHYGVMTLINKTVITPMVGKEGYYNVTASGIDMGFVAKDFQAEYNGVKSSIVSVAVIVPKYSIRLETESMWAYSAEMTVIPESKEDLPNIMSAIELYLSENGATWTKTENMLIDAATGSLTVKGLKANMAYYFKTTCDDGGMFSDAIKQSTEGDNQIPNGNFESFGDLVSYSGVQNGGRSTYTSGLGSKYNNYVYKDISYENPIGWSTTNSLTVPAGANIKNTWYMVPSILKASEQNHLTALELRSVAWNDAGDKVKDNTPSGVFDSNPKNAVQPPTNFKRSAGKIYLGSLSGENKDTGISFESRPAQITFYYKYVPKTSGDNTGGTINFTLESSSGAVLAKFDRELSSQIWTKESIDIPYQLTTAKAARLKMMFTSSTHWSYSQDEENRDIKTTPETNNNDDALKISAGSELYIDDIELIYK